MLGLTCCEPLLNSMSSGDKLKPRTTQLIQGECGHFGSSDRLMVDLYPLQTCINMYGVIIILIDLNDSICSHFYLIFHSNHNIYFVFNRGIYLDFFCPFTSQIHE
ncbi:Hypothetical_protein [Hexamita inflata]|uniref:Hypothetical_protein n=1 Tax=Hexamita inflata TaxID=28002 RepID=A0AA86TKT3_9EUKA|nr:Hypothetical protein HINF_LOCUS9269 [Hexamita inflata]